ncbi:hypothetical protein CQW23_29807 [Capsicum baccatum]|uniref:Ubiquitin-like protease family profile domain-containing protein n=1 Tax=Capsicum baccatum TaxID=33114 RepID=A0A2G2VCD4_CAPBA|nr:hypothetical protein CQW23_29807 [Capsicum baccatum]
MIEGFELNDDESGFSPETAVGRCDVEGVSADIGPATLESLIAVMENLKPDSANVRTSTMQVDYSSILLESAQVELDVILEDWVNLEAYRDKITQRTQFLNEHPFEVEDCGVFVAGYAEYLSEGINVPSDGFEAEYHRMCYTTLLRKYGIQKTQKGYVSENDDPPRPTSRNIRISGENEIVSIE